MRADDEHSRDKAGTASGVSMREPAERDPFVAEPPDWRRRGILFLMGLLGAWRWAAFVSYGRSEILTYRDFVRVGYYYTAVQEALRQWTLPLYYPAGIDGEWVNFYWAHPDTPLLPHLSLLHFVDPGTFVLLTTLAFYTAGYCGVLAIARRYRLSLVPTLLLALLFLGNGYIAAHLGAGHIAWSAYFLAPWWCYYAWALADGEPVAGTSLKLAAVLAITLLNGATHLAIWCWAFLAVIAITQLRATTVIVRAACWFVLFTAIRLVPTWTVFPLGVVTHFAWMGGYDWNTFLAAIFGGQPAITQYRPLFQWEYDAYLGAPAILFLVSFGLVAPFFLRGRGRHLRLLAAVSFFVFAMCGDALVNIRDNSGLPLIGGQRLPTRMVIMPMLVLIMQGCVALQRIIERTKRIAPRVMTACAVALLCVTAIQLDANARLSAPRAGSALVVPAPYLPVAASGSGWGTMPIAAVTADPTDTKRSLTFNMIYVQAIAIGSVITFAGLLLAAMMRHR